MADDNETNNATSGKSLFDQAAAAINKAGKDATLSKLKDILKRKAEFVKGASLCDAEATKLVADFEAGLI
jgi:hypothetical protein